MNSLTNQSIQATTRESQAIEDRIFWKNQTPEMRLDMVEQLRLEAGKFIYEYPSRFQRVIGVVNRV